MRQLAIFFALAVLVSLATGYGRDEDKYGKRCELEKDEGTCHEKHNKFYFDMNGKRCKEFVHRGCRKNENNFHSRDECYRACRRQSERMDDRETTYHQMKIKMSNPFNFYKMHKSEYIRQFELALVEHLPISISEINIKEIRPGSTIISVEIERSFTDDSMKKLLQKIKSGTFTFTVAGETVSSARYQDPKHEEVEGAMHRKLRCRKIAFIVIPIVLLIVTSIVILCVIKAIKHKQTRPGPIEVDKTEFETSWSKDSPDTLTIEKKVPPETFVSADGVNLPPDYDTVNSPPPAYVSHVTLRGAERAEESIPPKNANDITT